MKIFNEKVFAAIALAVAGLSASDAAQTTLNLTSPDYCEVRSSPAVSSNGIVYISDSTNLFAYSTSGTSMSLASGWPQNVNSGRNNPFTETPYQQSTSLYSSPAIGPNGTIHVGSFDGYLYAFNPDGSSAWTFDATNSIVCTPAVSTNGTTYFGDEAGVFYALDGCGHLLPGFPIATPTAPGMFTSPDFRGSPVIGIGGVVYIVGDWGSLGYNFLVAFQGPNVIGYSTNFPAYGNCPTSGDFGGDFVIGVTPSVGPDGTVYVGAAAGPGSDPGMLFAFEPFPDTNGLLQTKWSYSMPDYHAGDRGCIPRSLTTTPIIGPLDIYGNFSIYACTGMDEVFGFRCNSGGVTTVDKYGFGPAVFGGTNVSVPIFSTPALDAGGILWISSCDSNLYAIPGSTLSSPTSVAHITFDAETDPISINSSPVIHTNGVLFIGSNGDGITDTPTEYLNSFDATNGPANSPWPMWRNDGRLDGCTNVPFQLVNVQFGVTSATKTGPAAIGYSASDYWNVLSPCDDDDICVSSSDLLDEFGNSTSITMEINSKGTGSSEAGATDPLLNHGLADAEGGEIDINIGNLPAGTYDFYLYGVGGSFHKYPSGLDRWNAIFDIASGTSNFASDETLTTSTDLSYDLNTWIQGNQYVVFRRVQTVGSSTPVVIAVNASLYHYFIQIVNGIQIVKRN